jgi:hypothetical protein
MVMAFAVLLYLEGAALSAAWLPVDEAAVLSQARGGAIGVSESSGVLYSALLAPVARSLSASTSFSFAKALSAVLWASTAIPAYVLARRLVPWAPALAVAGLAVAAPASVYATAAVPEALALVLGVSSLALLVRASERGSTRDLLGAVALAAAAAITRPWFVLLPLALLVAYGLPRRRWRAFLRWPRTLWLAGLAGGAYLVLAAIAPDTAIALASPDETARAGAASLVVAVVGLGIVPWLLAPSAARALATRPETALLVGCVPALALTAGVLGAASPGRGLDERPLLVLGPLVLALGAAAWLGDAGRPSAAVVTGAVVVLAALALPSVDLPPTARAAGLSVVSPDGGSRAFLVAGVSAAVAVALMLLLVLRGHRILLPAALAIPLVVGQVAAWSSIRDEARALADAEPVSRGWVDRHVGSDDEVVIAGPAEALTEDTVAQLTIWNRAVRGVQELDLSYVDPEYGQWGVVPAAEVALVRGTELAGEELARSAAGVLLRPETPYRLAETIEGVASDGWSGDRAVYRRWSGSGRPRTVVVSVSRADWAGPGEPAEVRIASAPLDSEDDEPRAHVVLAPGQEQKLEIDVPEPPFKVVVMVDPTFPAAEIGLTDGRQLGAKLRFSYRPSD